MKFWQSLIFCEPDQLVEVAPLVESNGYEGVVLPDHVAMPAASDSSYPYSEYELDPKAPFLDPWAAITAMATVTTRLRFSTYVYILPMRDPFSVAKSVATASILSQGRVALGLGVGWLAEEIEILGHRFAERGRKSDEMIEILTQLFTTGTAELHGRHFDFPRVYAEPRPGHPVPIYVGGHTDAAIRRAARTDGWMGLDFAIEEIPAVIARVRSALAEEQRRFAGDPERAFEIILSPRAEPSRALYAQLEEMGVTGVILPAFSLLEGDYSTLEAKRARLEHFAEAFC